MEDLLQLIRRFNRDRDWEQFHNPKNLAMALCKEAAEIAEVFQWLTGDESDSLKPAVHEVVRLEIGDAMIYLLTLSDRLGIDALAAARDKLEVNRQNYPADKARGKALKYTEYQ